jgi:hypothetical protein
MVDEAYKDRTEWIKKSIRTTAKVSDLSHLPLHKWFDPIPIHMANHYAHTDGQVQLGPCDPGLRAGVLEHRATQASLSLVPRPRRYEGRKSGSSNHSTIGFVYVSHICARHCLENIYYIHQRVQFIPNGCQHPVHSHVLLARPHQLVPGVATEVGRHVQ